MNVNQIVNMVMRMIMRQVVNKSVKAGMNAASGQMGKRAAARQNRSDAARVEDRRPPRQRD